MPPPEEAGRTRNRDEESRIRNRKRLTLTAMCLATFIAILDTTVVNLALHAIQADLRASLASLQWVVDAYNVAYASFILTGGALGDLFGRRRVFATGIGLFTLGSVLCAVSPNAATLIAGRAIAGLGSALQLPGALAILAVTFPDARERAHAIALWGGFNGLALAIGPTAGGFLVDWFGWRSIFYLVLPFGIAVLLLTYRGISESSHPESRRLDLPGQLLAVAGLGLLALTFIEGPSHGWSSWWIRSSALACAACLLAFWKVERSRPGGLLEFEVFGNRMFRAAFADAVLMTFGVYSLLFIFPLYLQGIRGDSAILTGAMLLPLSLTFFAVSPFAGRLLIAFGPRATIATGMSLIGAGMFALAQLTPSSSYLWMLPGLLGVGVGLGCITGPIPTVAVSSVPHERSGMSSALVNVGRMVGATLGVAILGSFFGAHAGHAAANPGPFLHGMRRALLGAGTAEVTGALIALTGLPGNL